MIDKGSNVGLIGVGLMGHGIARNVLGRGEFPLRFMEHPGNQPVDEILTLGGITCASAAEVAAASDVVILCVTGAPQVEAVISGPGGVLEGLQHGSVVVDCSTSLPNTSVKMAAAVKATGGEFIDAPMTKLAKQAHEGTLNLLAGGDAATLERVRPVLDSFSERIDHVGGVGDGHRMKLLHNFVSIGSMTLIAEAAAHATDAGIDPAVFVEVLATGGGRGVALERISPFITDQDASSVPFTISNALKDLTYYGEMAESAGANRVVSESVKTALGQALPDGDVDSFVPELVRLFRT
jgi:3-hydroxyisobutyrate dehydrogenase-like beta-hydroxyacid dehydrogenase